LVKVATWNVNSVKARLPIILDWLRDFAPDVVLLQEIKCTDDSFPRLEIEELGYNLETHGQKTYNGVAIASKSTIEDVVKGLPGDANDEQARYIEATVFGNLRVASIYLPNGNPIDSEKFPYKLKWMDRLRKHTEACLSADQSYVFAGDYNIIQNDDDVYDATKFAHDALTHPESRGRFRSIVFMGLTDAFRALNNATHQYSYWDYKAGSWQKDNGLLIDHILLSPVAADRLVCSGIDRNPRGKERPSDHTPVWCELTTEAPDHPV